MKSVDKAKKAGIILAAALFVFAIGAKYVSGEAAENIVLPILALICTVLCVIHIAVLKSYKDRNVAVTDLVRTITFGVVALILWAAVTFNFIT